MQGGVWIGTSGWSYKGWADTFYPAGWPKSDQFGFYITQFPTVEINLTFYRLPLASMVEGWNRKAPEHFRFALKGSRYVTHMKKLVEVERALEMYFDRIKPLQKRVGAVLWQFPPSLHKDVPRLERFLSLLPKDYRYAVEFRHPGWIDEETFRVLRKHDACCVWISSKLMPLHFTRTSDFVYARFHGLEGGAAHDYTHQELLPWANAMIDAAKSGKSCYAYFNNDWNTRAPLNAASLMKMAGEWSVLPFAELGSLPRPGSARRR